MDEELRLRLGLLRMKLAGAIAIAPRPTLPTKILPGPAPVPVPPTPQEVSGASQAAVAKVAAGQFNPTGVMPENSPDLATRDGRSLLGLAKTPGYVLPRPFGTPPRPPGAAGPILANKPPKLNMFYRGMASGADQSRPGFHAGSTLWNKFVAPRFEHHVKQLGMPQAERATGSIASVNKRKIFSTVGDLASLWLSRVLQGVDDQIGAGAAYTFKPRKNPPVSFS